MDCTTVIDWIATIRILLFVVPLSVGVIADLSNGIGLGIIGGIGGGFIGYILNIISKLPVVEKFLFNVLSLAVRIGECS